MLDETKTLVEDIRARMIYWDDAKVGDMPDNRSLPEVPSLHERMECWLLLPEKE